jgi:uncharacterized protein
MHYPIYGKTGVPVSHLGMGGMRFTDEMSDEDGVAVIHEAYRRGVTYFDTAPGYCGDRSETIYGKALRTMPGDSWTIATKGMNTLSGDDILQKISRSRERLGVETIDFYFLWCIITLEQYQAAVKPGASLDAIIEAKKRGWIRHIGVSTHLSSAGIKILADNEHFEFMMVPYNAVNFGQREEGIRYARERGLGIAAMNPLHGGIIASYSDNLALFAGSGRSGVEEGMRFVLESPYITVSLSGMNSLEQVIENSGYADRYAPLTEEEFLPRMESLKASFDSMCTSCAYCLPECPEGINIPAYMEVYNHYLLTGDLESTRERLKWHHTFGLLKESGVHAAHCISCGACESKCTQYLDIIRRLEWLDTEIEQQLQSV